MRPLLPGILGMGLAASAAIAAPPQYVVKQPAGRLVYKIVLSGDFDDRSAADTPVEQQWHDVVHIHRTIKVSTTMFRVPAASAPDCGKACGDDWSGRALEALQQRVHKRCKGGYACSAKMMAAGTNAITVLANLQSRAAEGPTWTMMEPCTATATIKDTESLTRYLHADETGAPAGKDPGLVTRKGRVNGQVKDANCGEVLDSSYAIYLTAPRGAKGYILQIPPFVVPVAVFVGDGSKPESDHVTGFVLRENALRLGDSRNGPPLPLPAPGQPCKGRREIKLLFRLDSSPVFHRNARIPVSAEVTWQFTPAAASPESALKPAP